IRRCSAVHNSEGPLAPPRNSLRHVDEVPSYSVTDFRTARSCERGRLAPVPGRQRAGHRGRRELRRGGVTRRRLRRPLRRRPYRVVAAHSAAGRAERGRRRGPRERRGGPRARAGRGPGARVGRRGRSGRGAGRAVRSFIIISTADIGGRLEAAKYWNIEKSSEDFGQTLAGWGSGPGPYLILPFFEPMTVRDGIGKGVDGAMNPLSYVLPFF